MAGHMSVPVYPTMAADAVRQIFLHRDAKAFLSASCTLSLPDAILFYPL